MDNGPFSFFVDKILTLAPNVRLMKLLCHKYSASVVLEKI